MATSPNLTSVVQPTALGALLLLALRHLRDLDFETPTTARVLAAVGASKSRALELIPRLEDALAELVGPPGRPLVPEPEPEGSGALTRKLLAWLMEHPGAVEGKGQRARYAPSFKRKILELREAHEGLELKLFAAAVNVPVETLRDWLSVAPPEAPRAPTLSIDLGRFQQLLAAWSTWEGDFSAFCRHVREHLRLRYGDTFIGDVLEAGGVRQRQRRRGRRPDELALRGSFETFFPGAQWEGDGTELNVELDGQRFGFNVELDVDVHTGVLVGLSVRDTEDSAAVIEAFDDGVATTGAPPLAITLDGRPSNHTDDVHDALGETLLIPATPARGQSKARVEGAFGLLAQTAPPLTINAPSPREAARQLLALAVVIWARTLNNRRPRRGPSRAERYRDAQPDPEQVDAARRALEERLRRQLRARQTREARQDPIARALIAGAFRRLNLDDPTGNVATAIAGYPLDAIIDGIAIYEGKRAAATLPDGAGPRYLLGIVRNIAARDEGLHTIDALWRLRLQARDHMLRHLELQHAALARQHAELGEFLGAVVDAALSAEALVDRRFWLHAAGDLIHGEHLSDRERLFRLAARRANASFRVHHQRRADFVRHLAQLLIPLS